MKLGLLEFAGQELVVLLQSAAVCVLLLLDYSYLRYHLTRPKSELLRNDVCIALFGFGFGVHFQQQRTKFITRYYLPSHT